MQLMTCLVICLATFTPGPCDDVTSIEKRCFRIPFRIAVGRRNKIDWLYLYASRDKGKTWKKAIGVSPHEDSFAYSAPEDGLYWFAIQVVRKDRDMWPAATREMTPDLKVVVNTAARLPDRSNKGEIEALQKEMSELRTRLREAEKQLETLQGRQLRRPKRK